MVKTHWVKNAAILGTAVTLSLVAYPASEDVSAASVSQETEMAGFSLSLDKYYTNTVTDKDAVTTVAASAKTSEKKTTEKKTTTKKAAQKTTANKPTESKRWQTTGISKANH